MLDVLEFSPVDEDDFDDFEFDGEHLELESEIGARGRATGTIVCAVM